MSDSAFDLELEKKDYKAEENKERFKKDKAAYFTGHLDRDRWCHMLDEELFETFVKFYDGHLT